MDTFYVLLKQFIISSRELLSVEDIKEVEHYFNHSEYEMALEGLLIELTKLGKYPREFNFSEWRELGEHYQLDKETVFDEFIWIKFLKWGNNHTSQNI
ncbi:hypothetical protein LOZ80_12105 [Paenibacillus sp. HWE-109]|uniref:hypothetical protein n=1 Tax=Paenibacillus sp. HWE-109 TaxID=1306526 RepID=UPI001EE04E71|nr:hypothetical protein [Paenibacillus sp. HWE-109]UKS29628.1 hypothetical protein LOZ80_12105 [Paenibacillus sp. HWE-109]